MNYYQKKSPHKDKPRWLGCSFPQCIDEPSLKQNFPKVVTKNASQHILCYIDSKHRQKKYNMKRNADGNPL